MPVDPEISLGVVGGGSGMMQAGGGPRPVNPLEMAQTVTAVQKGMAEAKMAQAQLAARRRAGEIMAQAPDPESGVSAMMKDPLVQQFPDITSSVVGTYGSLLEAQGKIGSQGRDALSNVISQFPAIIQDPNQRATLRENSVRMASPAVREKLGKSIDRLYAGLDQANPDGSAPTPQQQVQRMAGWAYANGAGDAVPRILGDYTIQQAGNKFVPVYKAPAQGAPGGIAPGTVAQGPGAVGIGIAPGGTAPGTFPFAGTGPETIGGGNALVRGGPGSSRGGNNLSPHTPAVQAAEVQLAPQPTTSPGEAPRLAGDGKPLFGKGWDAGAQKPIGRSVSGQPVWNAPALVDEAAKDYSEEHGAYKQSQNTLSSLAEMDNNFDYLGKHGGLVTPGSFGEDRTRVARFINTLSTLGGGKAQVDPKDVAAGEDIMKITQRMGPQVLQSLLGQQREAAETIVNMNEKGVPGINNSVLGGKLLISSIRQATQRLIDLHDFKTEWANAHEGNMFGADKAFNEKHPATEYLSKAMEEYGLTDKGFDNLGALENAVRKGYMTPEQAAKQAKLQGFKLPGGK